MHVKFLLDVAWKVKVHVLLTFSILCGTLFILIFLHYVYEPSNSCVQWNLSNLDTVGIDKIKKVPNKEVTTFIQIGVSCL